MRVRVCVCMCICVPHVHMCVLVCIAYMCVPVCVCIHECLCVCVCLGVCVHVYLCVHVYPCVSVCMSVYVCVCTCASVCLRKHYRLHSGHQETLDGMMRMIKPGVGILPAPEWSLPKRCLISQGATSYYLKQKQENPDTGVFLKKKNSPFLPPGAQPPGEHRKLRVLFPHQCPPAPPPGTQVC